MSDPGAAFSRHPAQPTSRGEGIAETDADPLFDALVDRVVAKQSVKAEARNAGVSEGELREAARIAHDGIVAATARSLAGLTAVEERVAAARSAFRREQNSLPRRLTRRARPALAVLSTMAAALLVLSTVFRNNAAFAESRTGWLFWTGLLSALLAAVVVNRLVSVRLKKTLSLGFPHGRLEDATRSARTRYEQEVEAAITAAMTELLSSRAEDRWSTSLDVRLAEEFDRLSPESLLLDMPAANELRDILGTMGSGCGSIGLAGPRGAGKTTLLQCVQDGGFRVGDRPFFGVVEDAPVRYDPRDFMLHVFASLCRAICRKAHLDEDQVRELLRAGFRERVEAERRSWLRLVVLALGYGGTAISVTSILVAANRLPSYAIGLSAGVVLMVTPVVLRAVLSVDRDLTSRPREAAIWPRLLNRVAVEDSEVPRELTARALADLADIRFQQSFTSGWSGSVKSSAGLEAGLSTTINVVDNQMTLPAIASRFRELVREANVTHTVVIGVDEVDKIGDPLEAQRFINDIKMLYETGCFFFVSVSEDALAAFQLRGVPVRDAFDSGLGEVVAVPYLDIDCTVRLLRGRAVMPEPFLCLAYALSGGLAREALRIARQFIVLHQGGCREPIGCVAQTVVLQEFNERCQALLHSVSVLPTSKARSYVSEIFSGLPRDEIEPAELRVIANDLQLCAKRSEDDRIADLLRTASVLCGYYAHVLDVFVAGGAREVPGRDDASRAAVSLLGRTRQALAVDAGLAWSTLAELGTAIR